MIEEGDSISDIPEFEPLFLCEEAEQLIETLNEQEKEFYKTEKNLKWYCFYSSFRI